MSELNENQRELAEHTEGMVIVDAGPGTGKTHTIVERYLNLIGKDIDPLNILMLTFTKNAAQEMRDRISEGMLHASKNQSDISKRENMERSIKNIRTSTFDAMCLKIVLNSPETVSEFFGLKESLSRSARLIENETLNKEYFNNFYARFVLDHGDRYIKDGKNIAAIASTSVGDLYELLKKLMSRGIIPLEFDWFGKGADAVAGRPRATLRNLQSNGKSVESEFKIILKTPESYNLPEHVDPTIGVQNLTEDFLADAAEDDRFLLLEFIRDVYFAYIEHSVSDNRLTFGLASLFAFATLYSDERARSMNSVDYMMIDEFQDTNELQLMICLLLLKKPNLCVVGDWKQGIYGFRYASKENITEFETRTDLFITRLNRDEKRVPFRMQEPKQIRFTDNYRSSSLILEKAFMSLKIPGNDTEIIPDEEIVELRSNRDEEIGAHTAFEIIDEDSYEAEISAVVRKIIEYRRSGKYKIVENGTERDVRYSDIAVLSRKAKTCREILEQCGNNNVPAFYQGDLEVMSTREGKLALAWLRFVNNANDARGIVAILADMGYPMSEILGMIPDRKNSHNLDKNRLPDEIIVQRSAILNKRRRPNDLLTSIFAFYNLDNDITQSIVNIISSAYSGSLLTISDLIRLIEEDIQNSTKYEVDPSLDVEAVTIQTMHKSKGLEYPIVIVAGINTNMMPNTKGDTSIFRFNDTDGIRCTKEFFAKENDGIAYEKILNSWRFDLISAATPKDYSEERRLLFVAMSRAKQYLAMTCWKPSNFILRYGIANAQGVSCIAESESPDERKLEDAPMLADYEKRRSSLSVHDLMGTIDSPKDGDEEGGKGAEYGTKVHDAAYLMSRGLRYDDSLAEMEEVRSILDSLSGAKVSTEVKCVLPVDGISIKGIIDVIAEFDDHVEIHDYKTDVDHKYIESYRLQLSIYALAAASLGKKDIRCFIDFVSRKERIRIDPLPIEEVKKAISSYNDNITRKAYPGIWHSVD